MLVSMPLDRAAPALLAIRLNGTNLSVEHGAPVRLVVPGGECSQITRFSGIAMQLVDTSGGNRATRALIDYTGWGTHGIRDLEF